MTESKYDRAGRMLDKMIADYRADMCTWQAAGKQHAPRWVDAGVIAAEMIDLARVQPEVTGWILAVALQRFGDAVGGR